MDSCLRQSKSVLAGRDADEAIHKVRYVHTLVNRMRVLGYEATLEEIAERMCDIHNDSRYDMIVFLLTEPDE